MNLNFEQMREKFGVIYTVPYSRPFIDAPCKVKEVFPFQLTSSEKDFDNEKDALTESFKEMDRVKELDLKYLNDLKIKFNELSFLKKTEWAIKNRKTSYSSYGRDIDTRIKNIEDKYSKNKESVVVEKLDRNKIYKVNTPENFNEKAPLFLVVEKDNVLKRGVYEAKIVDNYYFMRDQNSGLVDVGGKLEVIDDDGKQHKFGLRVNEDTIETDFIAHKVFQKLEDAAEYHYKNMKELANRNQNNIQRMMSKMKP